MTGCDVAIVGGGVVGLSVAYVLAQEGFRVTVLDRGPLGRAASWAGAGIVSPAAGRASSDPMVELRSLSARLHAEWTLALRDQTGIDNGYRRCGGVDVADSLEEERELDALARLWLDEGIAHERLSPDDFPRIEPALNPALRMAYWLPDRAQIRNPWHLRALISACEGLGVRLRPGASAEGFQRSGETVSAIWTPTGPIECERVVVAAGPWSAAILEGLGLRVTTPPVKGQIVLLRCDQPRLRRIVEHGKRYLVPREDGRVLVGATEENAGFDLRSTPTAVRDLIDEALQLCPLLAEAEVETTWAGLRPGSLDSSPYLGFAPGLSNVIVATGHRRVGLQLSTGTAAVVADLVMGRPARIDLSPFRLDREPSDALGGAFRS